MAGERSEEGLSTVSWKLLTRTELSAVNIKPLRICLVAVLGEKYGL